MRKTFTFAAVVLAALLITLTAAAGGRKDKEYSDPRFLTDSEYEMFQKTVSAADSTSTYKPFMVWTRTGKGTDYMFFSSRDDHAGHFEKCHVHIFKPTDGEPVLVEIKKF